MGRVAVVTGGSRGIGAAAGGVAVAVPADVASYVTGAILDVTGGR
jgi:NAD(P)-dependent dehydrogenase (short-subunit alcohol dehydrogenase family)